MDEPALPERSVLVHIGPHKTGTTSLQGALAAARPVLKRYGIFYPAGSRGHTLHAAAALHRPLGRTLHPVDRKPWRDLSAKVRAHKGRAVLSSEDLCQADPAAATRIVRELGGESVHIVVTLRPLEKLLPSSWQQQVRAGSRVGYERWLEDVLRSRSRRPVPPSFWLGNDYATLVRRWGDVVGLDRVLVVIVDPNEARRLFDSFEQLLDLPNGTLYVDSSGMDNRSLTRPETEMLRALNCHIPNEVKYQEYYRRVKPRAVRDLIDNRTPGPGEARIQTPGWAVERAREYAASDVADIDALGVRVLGNLNELVPCTPLPTVESADVGQLPAGLAASFIRSVLAASAQVHAHDCLPATRPAPRATRQTRLQTEAQASPPVTQAAPDRLGARSRRWLRRVRATSR